MTRPLPHFDQLMFTFDPDDRSPTIFSAGILVLGMGSRFPSVVVVVIFVSIPFVCLSLRATH